MLLHKLVSGSRICDPSIASLWCRRLPQRRDLHLAPPFLLDEYVPRYQLVSSVDAARKRSLAYAHLRNCNLCPRLCGVNRYEKTGHCLIGADTVKVNVIAPHFGEEPCIQGHNGSGSVFFSGCNLRCVFCQNHVSCNADPTISESNIDRGYRASAQRVRLDPGRAC